MKKGIFINFEGIDSSGKKTQANMLCHALRKMGYDVVELNFPAYESTFGKIVGAYLRGEFGKNENIPEIPSLLFAIDRYQFKHEIADALKNGKIIVCNRYTQSAMAFEGSMNQDKKEIIEWISKVESRLPQPDLIFLLDMPVEATIELIKKREKKEYLKDKNKDILEEDIEFQKKVRKTYLELAKDKKWKVINCAVRNERWIVKSIQDIHDEILNETIRFLNSNNKD
ncbi:MAG: dTMP kinase [Candidatus Aenigmatarchaeota archaeon]|nr:dTMP kinase [Candidatus Aenigmarchaeota archaeon]